MVPNFEKIKNCITSKSGIKNDRLDPDPPLLSYSPIISGYFFQKSGSRWSEVFCVEIGDILDLSTSCQIYTNLLKLKCNYISNTEIQKGCEFRKWSLIKKKDNEWCNVWGFFSGQQHLICMLNFMVFPRPLSVFFIFFSDILISFLMLNSLT